MMEQREYYCFVAGLPEITFDGSDLWTTPAKFVEDIRLELHPEDFEMARLLLLRHDHENVVRFLMGKDLVHESVERFSPDDFKRQKEIFGAIIPQEDIMPPYMAEVLRLYSRSEEPLNRVDCLRKLEDGYYSWVKEKGSRFVREYTEFEYNLSNMLTYIINTHAESDHPDEGIAGQSSFVSHILETAGKTLVKDPEFEYFDDILSIESSSRLAGAEIQYDRLRWDVVEKLSLFEFFTADAVLAYLQKLLILSRWEKMTEQAGREKLLETVGNALGNAL